jgi:hypothetical protein
VLSDHIMDFKPLLIAGINDAKLLLIIDIVL